MELFKASKQWASRPDDERFWSIQETLLSAQNTHALAKEIEIPTKRSRVAVDGEDLRLVSPELDHLGISKPLISNYAFTQLCYRGEPSSPPSYLRKLPPTLAAQVLNHCMRSKEERFGSDQEPLTSLLIHGGNGSTVLRAATSDKYERIWDDSILSSLSQLPPEWIVPPARRVEGVRYRAATEADLCLSSSIRLGEEISPSGIY